MVQHRRNRADCRDLPDAEQDLAKRYFDSIVESRNDPLLVAIIVSNPYAHQIHAEAMEMLEQHGSDAILNAKLLTGTSDRGFRG